MKKETQNPLTLSQSEATSSTPLPPQACAHARARARRSSAQEVHRRVSEIIDIAVEGRWTQAQGRQLACKWGISSRTLSGYVSEAFRVLDLGEGADALTERRANNLLKLDVVYEKALAAGDHKAAIMAVRESNSLAGLCKVRGEFDAAALLGLPTFARLAPPPAREESEDVGTADNASVLETGRTED